MPADAHATRRVVLRKPLSIWIAGSVAECLAAAETGLIDAVVTNPTVVAEWCSGGETLSRIAPLLTEKTGLPLFLQTRALDAEGMYREARQLCAFSPLVIPKLPSTIPGLQVTLRLAKEGVRPLITTLCTIRQALAFASAGAGYLCPYFSRLADAGGDPALVIRESQRLIASSGVDCHILPASIRAADQIDVAMAAGAAGVLIFYRTFLEMLDHNVSTDSMEKFERTDWPRIKL